MANKDLKSLRFPGLVDRYVIDGMSDDAKEKLLTCFNHVAWTDENGQEYVNALENALYQIELTGITATFAQGSAVIYDTASLDDLKQYLTVTAAYSNGTTEEVSTYTLSGTLTAGTSVITASYGGYDATFNVTVTHQAGYYSVTNNLIGATSSNSATSIEENTAYSATITADSGYTLTGATVSVTMGGTDITSSAYSNGTISIASVTGAVVINVAAVAVTLTGISAVFTQSGTVYDTDTLDSLKSDLVVTATYSDSSTAVIPAADYTLSGTLAEGTSTVTVSVSGKTTTFSVSVTAWTLEWDYTDGGLPTVIASNDWSLTQTGTNAFTVSFDPDIGLKWVGFSGGYTLAPKNYQATSNGVMEIVVRFADSVNPNLYVGTRLNASADALMAFIYTTGVKPNGIAYATIPNTEPSIGDDHTLRIERISDSGKIYLDGVEIYSGELRTITGNNYVEIAGVVTGGSNGTIYVRAIRFLHVS